ncbi:PqqD family protein [Sphingomonas sp. ZT3P38]
MSQFASNEKTFAHPTEFCQSNRQQQGNDCVIDEPVAIVVNRPIVASETRDGEAIMMHHGTGTFFDTDGSGGYLWEIIESGSTAAGLSTALADAYNLAPDVATDAVEAFLAELRRHDLVVEGGSTTGGNAPVPTGVYSAPELRVHTDLADMLLLDPIHDVDEAGWPIAAGR